MKSIFRKIALSFLSVPVVGTVPLAVVSCANQFHDIRNDLETTDLGYVSDLSSETIFKVFLDKNPKVNKEALPKYLSVYGDSRQATIDIFSVYYKRATIKITYYSKLDFDQTNQKDYQLTKENNQFVISFRILDDTYDENVDPKITWFVYNNYGDDILSNLIEFSYQIDKVEKSYQVIVLLNENANYSLNASGRIEFLYWAKDLEISNGSVLANINLKVEI
ncbi:hypothetical protein LD125_00123 [Mesoplasma sp. JKS002658]|uniref:hypothetical protein n=1 Tax=Mesoplasma whartonense TaxID=2878854 RepID=UPI002022A84A|nr:MULTISPECIES: hypothetical protein [unclassified Mesoplasma]MCL8211563.1 hypothetical protein [Mesoplasma sp. JKS002664]MCL8212023.1 hypothetical protein [Mesoplasma sp. JKS002662]MCL8213738.1 hypothetical protein [Mesoplasma sp. JKS002660]MCL8213872.1 hypothetical protein [Mesoplasma sp. JKS002658]MCL8214838.1 hypothetical protein [Mesoplasma sp. JKS002663]